MFLQLCVHAVGGAPHRHPAQRLQGAFGEKVLHRQCDLVLLIDPASRLSFAPDLMMRFRCIAPLIRAFCDTGKGVPSDRAIGSTDAASPVSSAALVLRRIEATDPLRSSVPSVRWVPDSRVWTVNALNFATLGSRPIVFMVLA